MKNELKKAKTQKNRKVSVFILHALLLTCIAIFAFGCEELLQKTPGDKVTGATEVGGPQSKAIQIILQGLADNNPLVRVNAIEVVAATEQIKLMPKVQRLLKDEFAPVRFAAALATGDLEYSLGERSVRQLLRDRDNNVKIAASYAMVKLGFPEYSEVLRRAIASNDQTLRANAALLLGKSGDKNALQYLYWALRHKNSDDKVKFQAMEAIAMLGDEQILQRLWAIVYSTYADDRIMGIRAMGALGTPKAKDILITKLDDDILEVRLAAATQLGKFKDTVGEHEVLEVFTGNLTVGLDKIALERVNVLTALAIGQIGTASLTKYLPQLLENESKFVRIAAAKAVFQCKMGK